MTFQGEWNIKISNIYTGINIYIKKHKYKFEAKLPGWVLPHENETLGGHTGIPRTKFPT